MMDYELPGIFYLGRQIDPASRQVTSVPLLYDSKDLVTHAAIIGMTGSGKTGLGIGLIEEAAIDRVPVLAIDPKGDLGNLLLTFPDLAASDFEPWVGHDESVASSPAAAAAAEAERWKRGLTEWGQSGERIARLRSAAEFRLYTPGGTAGTPISILESFGAPTGAVAEDPELVSERVSTAATSLLTLAGIDVEPLRSREHILISTILQEAWRQGRSPDLAGIIASVQSPPVTRVGVLDLESFFPAADRFALATRLNHLLAAPGFSIWMEGDPLDIGTLLYSPTGRPRVSIVSIAHLDEAERMFFVSLLLNELVGWVRTQRGTSSLRAMVYFDEVVGFLPPVAMPPSKPPLLTLLKQARAYGVGLVLATQNPVDLDYKALANTGTWFLGRLQTERDKARVLDGLEGVAAATGSALERSDFDRLLSSLEKRIFLLHNIHDPQPILFQTRWTMSYLRGPLDRNEIARLRRAEAAPSSVVDAPPPPLLDDAPSPSTVPPAPAPALRDARYAGVEGRPVLDPSIVQLFAPGAGATWVPALLGAARVAYSDTKLGVDESRDVVVITPFVDGPVPVDWELAEPAPFELKDLAKEPDEHRPFAEPPSAATQPTRYAQWSREFARWVNQSQSVELRRSTIAKLTSHADESERDFRIRVQAAAREARDAAVAKVRAKHATKLATAEDRLRRAEYAVQREQEEASESKMQAGVSIAATIAGALLGRRAVSASTLGRATTAARGVSRAGRQSQDVARAEANVQALRARRDELAAELESELRAVAQTFEPTNEELQTVRLKPKRGGTSVQLVSLVWLPR